MITKTSEVFDQALVDLEGEARTAGFTAEQTTFLIAMFQGITERFTELLVFAGRAVPRDGTDQRRP